MLALFLKCISKSKLPDATVKVLVSPVVNDKGDPEGIIRNVSIFTVAVKRGMKQVPHRLISVADMVFHTLPFWGKHCWPTGLKDE